MTKPQQRIAEAREKQPDFHDHYEEHGRWAQANHKEIDFALALADKVLSGDYVVVPVEPTDVMMMRGYDAWHDQKSHHGIFKAMTAAAPKLDIIEEFEKECE